MLFSVKNFKDEQSIIQFTLLKVIICIFVFLILFIVSYGQSFWEKQDLQFTNKLLFNILDIQSKIYEDFNKNNNISAMQGEKTKNIQSIINNSNYIMGYYDIELDLLIKNYNNIELSSDKIISVLKFRNLTIDDKYWISIPIYNNKRLVGYLWTYAKKSDYVLGSFYAFYEMIILVLTLLAIVIFLIRKFIKQIQGCLDLFCQMIIHDNHKNESEQIVKKLPELAPVLNKIRTYTDNLKKLNQELELSKIKTTKIIEGISDGFCVLDRNWNFTYVNSKLQVAAANDELDESSDLIGKNIWAVFPQAVDTLSYEKMREAMAENYSLHWEAAGWIAPEQDHEYYAYPYTEGLIIFFNDITKLKQEQEELGRLERLNLIGQMAAGISHEIRNPLTTVRGFLQLFSSKNKYLQDRELMELMISEIDRANGIITDFLSLSKVNSDNRKLQNINRIIDKLYPMLQADAFNSNKEVTLELDDFLPDIIINENEIKQLILNIVRNGLEVTPENKKVFIKTYTLEDNVVLEIKDQGTGIPQEIQDKIGTPFFTTKETGTGLGLAISMGIAQRHGAIFKFDSNKEGTTFKIIFSTAA